MQEIKRINDEMQEESEFSKLNAFELDEYIKLLDNIFAGMRSEQVELMYKNNANESELNQMKAEYFEITKMYISLKAKLRNQSENFEPKAWSVSNRIDERPKFKITWNKFSGDYDSWLAFYVNFGEALKTNSALNEAAKYKILMDSTEGKAQALVKRFNSFDKAWDALRTFYGNAFRQANAALKKLWKIEAMKERTGEAFDFLIEQVDGYVHMLKNTLKNDELFELIPLIVVEKLDETTKHIWYNEYTKLAQKWIEMQIATNRAAARTTEAKDYIPNWLDMRCFLWSESEELKPVTKRRDRNVVSQMRKAGNAIQGQKHEFCTNCGEFHRLYKCKGYRSMTLSRRWDHVLENRLCVRCLHPEHRGQCHDPANNNRCEACKPDWQFHNSTLCRKIVTNW